MKYACSVEYCEETVGLGCIGCRNCITWPDPKVAHLHKSHRSAVIASNWHCVDGGRWINQHWFRTQARLGYHWSLVTIRRLRRGYAGLNSVGGPDWRYRHRFSRVALRCSQIG